MANTEKPSDPANPDGDLPEPGPDFAEQDGADEIDNIVPNYGYGLLPVVGLGGSAGAIPALRAFLERVPPAAGVAYVVVLHLAPDHDSILPELLQRHCILPVRAAEDGGRFEADRVYVIPPGKHLVATDGHMKLTEMEHERGRRVAVDLFFRSLADTHGAHAAAVVLSGVDGDGAVGLRRIKERGGLTIAQDPQEAEQSGMPGSAIATGMVDWVLRAAEMPPRIAAYMASESRLRLLLEEGPQPALAMAPRADEPEAQLHEVLAFLRTATGRDFTYYKRATIVRRISRRMQVCGVTELQAYLDHLRTSPGEAGALLQDLLISVTNFFRDREAFQSVEELVPQLFRNKGPEDSVRVWCAACATGEEAYSMAMLLLEHARKIDSPPTLQVFGCDLDDDAIQVARTGFYPDTIAADVSEERLRRHFSKEPGGWRVRRELREMVLFAAHDLLKDAPFSRMDLVSCRNLLIYLNRDAQSRALEIFNFALRPGGILFLGVSESVEDASPLFTPLHKKHRLYRQRPHERPGLAIVAAGTDGALHRAIRQHDRLKQAVATLPGRSFLTSPAIPFPAEGSFESQRAASDALHFRLLGRFGPASLVVNEDHDVVHLSENAHRYLQMPEGEPTRNLLRLVHPALRVELRAVLLRAEETQLPAEVARRIVEMPGGDRAVSAQVTPAGELAPGCLLVMFDEREQGSVEHADPAAARTLDAGAVVHQLERELTRTKASLRDTVEQSEAAAEEFKASNEELQAMNEELRSAGEELETGREELQSVNEELTTVNAELKIRVDELARANSDLHNLMSATQIATVFLDRELRIMRYTPLAVPLFNLIGSDVGRPLADLSRRMDYPQLAADVAEVLGTLVPAEREIQEDGHWFLARVLPYRTLADHIAGVVLTFVDITERRHAERALRDSEERLTFLLELSDAIRSLDRPQEIEQVAMRMLGEYLGAIRTYYFFAEWSEDSGWTHEVECEFRSARDVPSMVGAYRVRDFNPARFEGLERGKVVQQDDVSAMHGLAPTELESLRALGIGAFINVPLIESGRFVGGIAVHIGQPRAWRPAEIALVREVAARTWAAIELFRGEEALRESEARLRAMADNLPGGAAFIVDRGLRYLLAGGEALRTMGLDAEAFFGRTVREMAGAQDAPEYERNYRRALAGDAFMVEHAALGRHFLTRGGPLRDAHGRITSALAISYDITDRKRAEEAMRASDGRLQLIVENARDYAIFSMDPQRRIVSWNAGAQAILGYASDEAIGRSGDIIFTPEDRAAGVPEREAAKALTEGRASDERWHVRKDGSQFWASGMMTSMRDGGGPIGLVKIFRDETVEQRAREMVERSRQELRVALQETEAARDEAEAAGKAKDRFLATLSHELRAPLTPLLLAAQTLMRTKSLPPSVLSALEIVERNVRLEAQLVDDLLDVTRIATGKVELNREATTVREVIRGAVEVAQADIEGKRQTIALDLAKGRDALTGDVRRLRQVFWNLLKNASKFTPAGGRITVASRIRRGRAVVQIRDTGVGFQPDTAERIFGAFEQGSVKVTREFGGLGLGLAIAKASAEAHGGTIRAESAGIGQGATFTVELPLAAADAGETGPAPLSA